MDRVDKILLIQEQIIELRGLKNKLAVKIPCNNNRGYDFTRIANLEYKINYPARKLKNSEGQTLTEALAVVNENFQRVLINFENALTNSINQMYEKQQKEQ